VVLPYLLFKNSLRDNNQAGHTCITKGDLCNYPNFVSRRLLEFRHVYLSLLSVSTHRVHRPWPFKSQNRAEVVLGF
jgi:hypothetical protein